MARGIDNNNPGNIDFNQAAFDRDRWLGEVGLEEHRHARFTTFKTPEHGIRALCRILLTYQKKYDLYTVDGMIHRWAPAHENDTEGYVGHVCAEMNVEPHQRVVLKESPDMLERMTRVIILHENGEQPYSDETIAAGVGMALA